MKRGIKISTSTSAIIYEARQLRAVRSYDGHELLKPATVRIRQGEWISLIGHNGSGKSTLSRILCGMQRIGLELEGEEQRQADHIFPVVTQMTSDYLLGATPYEDLVISYEQYGKPLEREQLEMRIDELLTALQLYALKHVPIEQLSGGERQLVAFAGALLMDASCIILDEITSMLSETNKWRVCAMIRKLAREQGIAVIWITQQLDELEASDTVWVMHQLDIIYQGKAGALYDESGSHNDNSSYSINSRTGIDRINTSQISMAQETGTAHASISHAARLGLPIPWSVKKSTELGLNGEQMQFNPYGLAKVVKQRNDVTT